MQSLSRILVSLTLAAGCSAALAADRVAATATRDNVVAVPAAAEPVPTKRPADRKLLSTVRRAILHEKTLSTAAHNVRLAANSGVITVTGEVRSASEKKKVEALVAKVPGVTSVDSQLTFRVAEIKKPVKKPAPRPVRESTRAETR
jgi:hyperosmotically inducible protein